METIKGKSVMWKSENGNIAITYNQFAVGGKFNIYRKIAFVPGKTHWEYVITFAAIGEAANYAEKMNDTLVWR